MARNVDEIAREVLGNQLAQIIALTARVEQLEEQLKLLAERELSQVKAPEKANQTPVA